MIVFSCQHCGNKMHVDEQYAGRDGWCRVCKKMVIFPYADRPAERLEDLQPKELLRRMYSLLRHAANRADLSRKATQEAEAALRAQETRSRERIDLLTEEVRARDRALKALDTPGGEETDHALAALQEANASLVTQLEAARREGEDFRHQCDALTRQLADMEELAQREAATHGEARAGEVALSEDVAKGSEQLETALERAKEATLECESLRSALEESKTARHVAEAALAERERQLVKAEERLGTEAGAARRLQAQVASLTQARDEAVAELASAKETLADFEAEIVKLEKELVDTNAAQAGLVARLSALEAGAHDQRTLEQRGAALAEDLAKARKESAALRESLAAATRTLEQTHEDLARLHADKSRLSEELLRRQADAENLEKSLREASLQRDELATLLSAERDEASRKLVEALEESAATLQAEREERMRLEEALSDAAVKLEALKAQFSDGGTELEGLGLGQQEDGFDGEQVLSTEVMGPERGGGHPLPLSRTKGAATPQEQSAMMNAFRRFLDHK